MSRMTAPRGEVMTPMRRGSAGKGFLRSCGEESLGGQLGLELLEGDLQGSGAHRLHVFGEQLHLAARLVHGDASAGDDLHPVLRTEAQQARLGAKHHDAKLRVAVLEREVDVAALGGTIVGDFAFDPDIGKTLFQMGADGGNQLAHGEDAARRCFRGKLEGELRIAHLESLAGEGNSRDVNRASGYRVRYRRKPRRSQRISENNRLSRMDVARGK